MVRGGGARQALGGGLVVPGDRKATEDPGLCGGWRKVRKCSGHHILIRVGFCIKHSCVACCTVLKTNVEMPGDSSVSDMV